MPTITNSTDYVTNVNGSKTTNFIIFSPTTTPSMIWGNTSQLTFNVNCHIDIYTVGSGICGQEATGGGSGGVLQINGGFNYTTDNTLVIEQNYQSNIYGYGFRVTGYWYWFRSCII